jgi:hypothetical protein
MSTLAEDLKSCRKRLNISLEDISKNTRVPVSLFASIEDGTFFSNQGFTRTYIRSFARMYGKAIKLDETDIVRALDEDEAEMYSGFLHKKYVLGEVEKPIVVPPIPARQETSNKPEAPAAQLPDPVSQTAKPEPQRTPIESDRSVDWADMNAKINGPRRNSNSTMYLVVILILVLVAAATVYFVYNPFETGPGDQNVQQAPVEAEPQVVAPQDSVASTPVISPATTVSLPDTLKLIVYAINDKLDPVRITSDLKDRVNPYWIEQGAGREFEFRDTLILRGDASRFALIYNGHLINAFSDFRFDDDSLNYRITRSLLLQRPESQRPGALPDNVRPPILDF